MPNRLIAIVAIPPPSTVRFTTEITIEVIAMTSTPNASVSMSSRNCSSVQPGSAMAASAKTTTAQVGLSRRERIARG